MRVIVIGAGFGGLSAAAHLKGHGHDVTVLEQASIPGGRAGMLTEEGFRLDDGPAVLTMPNLLSDTFTAIDREMSSYVTLERVDPMYRAVFHDGSVLHIRHGREAMTEEIREFAGPDDAEAFGRFCDWLTSLYEVEMPNFIDRNYDSAFDVARQWRAALKLIRLGGFGRFGPKVESFFDDDRVQKAFSFQSLYAGVAPYEALALYGVITYMDSVDGVFAPVGGVHQAAAGLAQALTHSGVKIQYDTKVSRILRGADGAVNGVEIENSERLAADGVVCNADLSVAYRTLLGGVERPRVTRRGRYSPSCVLWIAGVRGEPPVGTARHNLHFTSEWRESFEAVTKNGVRMSDPSMLVTMHSVEDSTLAPAGHSTMYALEPVPNLAGKIDWSRERDRVSKEMQDRIAALGYPTDVVVERVYDPLDWESMGLEHGTPFSLSHTLRQSGPFRPGNTDKRVPGLVFTGASTVPGVGVPMVLLSGKLAAERMVEYAKATSVVRW